MSRNKTFNLYIDKCPCSKFRIFVICLEFTLVFFQHFGQFCKNEMYTKKAISLVLTKG